MKKKTLLLLSVFLTTLFYCSEKQPATQKIKSQVLEQIDSFHANTEENLLELAKKGSEPELQKAFKKVRLDYKKVEWALEYYAPTTSKAINGPPLPEIEVEETKTFEPSGLQVIEEHLFPFEEENRAELIREVKVLNSRIKHAKKFMEAIEFSEANAADACKLELFRIISLGISGFDTPLSSTSITEAAVSIKSVQNVLSILGSGREMEELSEAAIAYINKHEDFEEFNRAEFIRRYINPLTKAISQWQQENKLFPETELAIYAKAETLFDKDLLNPNFFADNAEAEFTTQKVALGKKLFSDPVLSGATRSCQSCHNPKLAFTDGLPRSAALDAGKFVKRNAPSLYYAGLQQAQFYDMRSPSLENQALDVLANKDEMHGSVEDAAKRLNNQPAYLKQFKAAFPTINHEIKPRHVMIAVSTYVRSLSPFNSRFDQYMRGGESKMNQVEIKGFNLFMGKAKCGTCHFSPVFNGTAPPAFTNTEAEVLGVPVKPKTGVIDPDLGRYAHNKIEELKFSFKTPTLRNIALTAPYMHNGAFATLEEVMEFYEQGGGAGLGIHLENQTLPTDKLNLSKEEQKAIISFLKTLTDEVEEKEDNKLTLTKSATQSSVRQ
ncbi:cytochrome-c peroxidase [Pedobacter sp. SYSU D00535]|uniref:cytochrome-c peroxidase n=1 Tax=Pedobacter sp. SYSU D00535 TaxID=2810308 RepID=UPI001A969997|nr:cytochrome c peroxidase [Pedobacter sp. SYSU D00535]